MTRLSTISTAIAGSVGLSAGVEGTLKKDATVYCVCPRRASVEQTVPESPITLSPSLSLTPFSHSLTLLLQPCSKHQSVCWHRRACIPPYFQISNQSTLHSWNSPYHRALQNLLESWKNESLNALDKDNWGHDHPPHLQRHQDKWEHVFCLKWEYKHTQGQKYWLKLLTKHGKVKKAAGKKIYVTPSAFTLIWGGVCGPWESLNLLALMYHTYSKALKNQTKMDNENCILAQKWHSSGLRSVWVSVALKF